MDDILTQIYSTDQNGNGLPYFAGSKQFGGGWLRTLARFAFPILKRVLGVATNTAEDVIEGRKGFKDSLVDNAMKEVSGMQRGSGKRKSDSEYKQDSKKIDYGKLN